VSIKEVKTFRFAIGATDRNRQDAEIFGYNAVVDGCIFRNTCRISTNSSLECTIVKLLINGLQNPFPFCKPYERLKREAKFLKGKRKMK